MLGSPLILSHPKKFETRTLSNRKIKDVHRKSAHHLDNKVLSAQRKLVDSVLADEVQLHQFCDTVKDLEKLQAEHARFRKAGFRTSEFENLLQSYKQAGQDKPRKLDPQLKVLYNQLKAGKLEAEEVVEELNWRSSQSYGEELVERKGPIYEEERYKFRTHIRLPRVDKKTPKKKDFADPEFQSLIKKAISLFPRLDADKNGIVDRREARTLVTDYQDLDLTPAEATTLYSRQKQLASAVDPKKSGEQLKMEDLELLLSENFPAEPSEELQEVVNKVSVRFAYQKKMKAPKQADFKLSDSFQARKVKQGKEGSCWLLCNLPALTEDQLAEVIKPEGDQYRVTLADGRDTLVDKLNEAERRLYSHGAGSWSGLIEKGVAQILHDEGEDLNSGYPRVAREMLTGKKSVFTDFKKAPKKGLKDLRDRDQLFEVMETALDQGSAIFAGAVKSDFEKEVSDISAANHAYTVLEVDRENDNVVVRNPWGRSERADLDGENDGVFDFTQDQFFANFSHLYMDEDVKERVLKREILTRRS